MAVSGSGTVLVLRALGVGDLLTAVPALRGVRRAFPGARLVLAAPGALEELVALIGVVDTLWPTAGPRSLTWRGEPPEIAVNLHGSGPESIEALYRSSARTVWSHAHPKFDDLDGPLWIDEQHERHRWCRLLHHFGVHADPDDYLLPPFARRGHHRSAVVVHPGASHRARQWPPDRFAEVASAFTRRGFYVVLTGSPDERPLAGRIAEAAGLPPDRVLAGRTGLAELAAVVAEAGLVLCGDTGVAHLATAFATPSVVLFGPVSPWRWGPPDLPRHVALWSGEVGDTFADRPDSGLLRLTPPAVLEAADAVLEHAGERAVAGG